MPAVRQFDSVATSNLSMFESAILKGGEIIALAAFTTRPRNLTLNLYKEALYKAQPGTTERYHCATILLRSMGYLVEYKGDLTCPVVYWTNAEGDNANETQFIHDVLHKDYLAE